MVLKMPSDIGSAWFKAPTKRKHRTYNKLSLAVQKRMRELARTFVFDNNATLNLILSGVENNTSREIPMLLKKGYYEADISTLPSGDYSFTASVKDENEK